MRLPLHLTAPAVPAPLASLQQLPGCHCWAAPSCCCCCAAQRQVLSLQAALPVAQVLQQLLLLLLLLPVRAQDWTTQRLRQPAAPPARARQQVLPAVLRRLQQLVAAWSEAHCQWRLLGQAARGLHQATQRAPLATLAQTTAG